MAAIHVHAPAKLNLFLHVGARAEDGYHAIASLAVFLDLADSLAVTRVTKGVSLDVTGPFAHAAGNGESNLVMRAVRAFGVDGLAIALEKNIPVAAGLGGGSADAAATLRALETLFPGRHSKDEIARIALSLGADVPMCLASTPVFAEGRGERLTPAPAMPSLPLVLVNPRVGVATAQVFGALKHRSGAHVPPHPARFDDVGALAQWLQHTTNDLEPPARQIAPLIGDALAALHAQSPLFAAMTGSGATCFAIFANLDLANKAAAALRQQHETWWIAVAQNG